jgi:hypothetical protein
MNDLLTTTLICLHLHLPWPTAIVAAGDAPSTLTKDGRREHRQVERSHRREYAARGGAEQRLPWPASMVDGGAASTLAAHSRLWCALHAHSRSLIACFSTSITGSRRSTATRLRVINAASSSSYLDWNQNFIFFVAVGSTLLGPVR